VYTTLIEQFPVPHTRGSSHGLSRAFRLLGELELDRLDYSLDRWKVLQESCGVTLLVNTSLLNFGPPGDSDLETFISVLRAANRPVEWLDAKEIARQFPMLRYPQEWGAARDPNGGILIAQRCLDAVQSRFKELGGQVVTSRVDSVKSKSGMGVQINVQCNYTGEVETRSFDRAVVCAGPWTSRLLPQLEGVLQSLLTPVTYWCDPTGLLSAARGFPIIFNARLTGVYGLPSCEYPGLVKMLFHGGPETDPDTRDWALINPYVKRVKRYIRHHLPSLDCSAPAIMETCMYTMTPDSNPIIDRVTDQLVVGCGFSGSEDGQPVAPLMGEIRDLHPVQPNCARTQFWKSCTSYSSAINTPCWWRMECRPCWLSSATAAS